MMQPSAPTLRGPRFALKGIIDRVAAAVLLVVLAPIFAIIAIVAKATSRGPVFFRQARVGLDGEEFLMWKFRTMVPDAEDRLHELADHNEVDGARFKMRDDPRVTRFGGKLRRLSLDELPQLVNVLRGEMSLIGPRPPLRDEVERYQDHVLRRLSVKPGITGLGQVEGRADLSWEDSVRLDLYYIDNWSPRLDVTILLKTLGAVARKGGAY